MLEEDKMCFFCDYFLIFFFHKVIISFMNYDFPAVIPRYSPYRYTHKKYVCELFLITHIHIIRGERKAALPFSEGSAVGEGILGTTSLQVRGPHHQSEP